MSDRSQAGTLTNGTPFLDLAPPDSDPDKASVHIVPLPYEGAVSYGPGASLGPQAVLEASTQVELYDEFGGDEPYRAGIATLPAPKLPEPPDEMAAVLYDYFKARIGPEQPRLVGLGGDHSVTVPHVRALHGRYDALSVIQLDAHADLRQSYGGSRYSHASVMRRIREMTEHTLQLGIRSLCLEEAEYIAEHRLPVAMMQTVHSGGFDLERAVAGLPDPVFITLDVDVLDWSVVSSTGTPEPGGVGWYELLDWLACIFSRKEVIGFDLVELAGGPGSRNSAFAVAKLMYKMIGMMLRSG